MNPELFARLNPKAPNIDNLSRRAPQKSWMKPQKDTRQRKPLFSQNDLNIALSGANKAGAEILYRKYADFPITDNLALAELFLEVLAMAVRFDWKTGKNALERLRRLFWLAILEVLDEIKCEVCEGTPERVLPGKKRPSQCPKCRGTGKHHIREPEKAQLLGMSKQAWYKYGWNHSYNEIKILVQTAEYQANKEATRLVDWRG